MQPPRSALVAAFAVIYLVWGSTYLAIHFSLETLPPFLMAGLRFVVAGLLLLAWSALRGAGRPTRRDWGAASVVGILLMMGGNGVMVYVMTRMPTGVASLLVGTVPIWMVGIDAVLARRRPGPRTVFGILAGTAAAAVLAFADAGWDGGADPAFVALLLFGCLSWAVGSLYSRYEPDPASMRQRAGMQMLVGGAALMVAAAAGGDLAVLPGALTPPTLLAMTYLVLAGSVLAYSCYVWLLRHVDAPAVASYAFVNPLVAVALGALFLDEPITPRIVAATVLIVAAVALLTLGRRPVPAPAVPGPEAMHAADAVAAD